MTKFHGRGQDRQTCRPNWVFTLSPEGCLCVAALSE